MHKQRRTRWGTLPCRVAYVCRCGCPTCTWENVAFACQNKHLRHRYHSQPCPHTTPASNRQQQQATPAHNIRMCREYEDICTVAYMHTRTHMQNRVNASDAARWLGKATAPHYCGYSARLLHVYACVLYSVHTKRGRYGCVCACMEQPRRR
jgi:hypothetical protein